MIGYWETWWKLIWSRNELLFFHFSTFLFKLLILFQGYILKTQAKCIRCILILCVWVCVNMATWPLYWVVFQVTGLRLWNADSVQDNIAILQHLTVAHSSLQLFRPSYWPITVVLLFCCVDIVLQPINIKASDSSVLMEVKINFTLIKQFSVVFNNQLLFFGLALFAVVALFIEGYNL